MALELGNTYGPDWGILMTLMPFYLGNTYGP